MGVIFTSEGDYIYTSGGDSIYCRSGLLLMRDGVILYIAGQVYFYCGPMILVRVILYIAGHTVILLLRCNNLMPRCGNVYL